MIQTTGWLNTLTGRNLLREEVRQVRRALDGIFGDQFVQVGNWGDAALFRRLARTRRAAVVTDVPAGGADVVTAAGALAIASHSVDAVFLPHTLELADDPHVVLREVDRVLRPDGHIVALGFNPLGWWGLRHWLSRRGFPPGTQRLISDYRLCDWLRLLDFTVDHPTFYYFTPPLIRGAPPRHPRRLRTEERPGGETASRPAQSESPAPGGSRPETSGQSRRRPGPVGPARMLTGLRSLRAWSAFAGCYLLVAHKRVFVVTPIRLAWKRRAALVGGLVNPTTRNAA